MPRLSRRDMLRAFIGALGSNLAQAWLKPIRAHSDSVYNRVVQVTDGRAWAGPGWTDADIDPVVLRSVIEKALKELTGTNSPSEALKTLIPSVSDPEQRYAIKVNCVNSSLSTHPTVVETLVDLLIATGARPDHIVVFDRSDHELSRCGYALGKGDKFVTAGTLQTGPGYLQAPIELSDGRIRLSRIITEHADHIINVPVLKNHSMAGVTLALKNHFGSIDEPQVLHGKKNDGCPGIAELSALPQIRNKTRLVLVDATFGTYMSGLAGKPDFAPMTIIAAAEPAAADLVGQNLINQRRAQDGLPPVEARHIQLAKELGLGPGSLSEVELLRRVNHPVEDKPKPWETSHKGGGCSVAPAGKRDVAAFTAAATALLTVTTARNRRPTVKPASGKKDKTNHQSSEQ